MDAKERKLNKQVNARKQRHLERNVCCFEGNSCLGPMKTDTWRKRQVDVSGTVPVVEHKGLRGVLSPLSEPLWVRTLTYPSRPAHPPCPPLQKLNTTTAPVALTECAQSPLEFVIRKKNICHSKKKNKVGRLRSNAHTPSSAADKRPPESVPAKTLWETFPGMPPPILRPSGTCRRKLRRPSTQCASCNGGLERLWPSWAPNRVRPRPT